MQNINMQKLEYPIPTMPDDSEKKSGMDRVLPKISGLGRVSGTRWALSVSNILDNPLDPSYISKPELIQSPSDYEDISSGIRKPTNK